MLKDQVKLDMVSAMKAGEQLKLSVLRMLSTAIKNKEIEKMAPLSEEEVQAVVKKEIKNRKKAIELYKQGNRPELVEKEEKEATILEAYVTAQ